MNRNLTKEELSIKVYEKISREKYPRQHKLNHKR